MLHSLNVKTAFCDKNDQTKEEQNVCFLQQLEDSFQFELPTNKKTSFTVCPEVKGNTIGP